MSVQQVDPAPQQARIPRTRPRLTPETEFFWTSGADGVLRFLRCGKCGKYDHPPTPICPFCLSRDVSPQPVSGFGTVVSFTVNHQAWNPEVPVPYSIVLVELDEQSGLRLVSNLVGEKADSPAIGMRVVVEFEQLTDEIFLPLFSAVEPEP